MKILVIGGGGREHAITWKLAQSPEASEIFVAPGNAGTAQIGRNVDIKATDISALARFAQEKGVGLAVVGPEGPLAEGIVDRFEALGIPVFGPSKSAARIEASKDFSKKLMQKYGIPCARSASFSDYARAQDYVKKQNPPIVIKADGLAAGKGVVVAESREQALAALASFMQQKALGAAADTVLIEEYLEGREMSSFAFSDGVNVVPMVAACDYKRVFDGNKGPNTGGMGSYSPPYFATPELYKKVSSKILEPTVAALAREGAPYKGVLYGGLMINNDEPKALEFNARFGDPETQVVLPRLKSDLVDICLAVIRGKLNEIKIEWDQAACVGVVLASGGYPGDYTTGLPISGLDALDKDVVVFHAGTRLSDGQVVTSGGRVLSVVGRGRTLAEARRKVYENVSRIRFQGCHYRNDIALINPNI